MTTETAIVSHLLCDLPDTAPPIQETYGPQLVRSLGLGNHQPTTDFQASLDAGFVEDLETYTARRRWNALTWDQQIALLGCWTTVVLATHVAQLEAAVAVEEAVR